MVVYLDNAATTYPKPEGVYEAHDRYLRAAANPGRGAYAMAVDCAREIFEARLALAGFLGISAPERLAFTGGCTQALNFALKGLGLKAGDAVVTSPLEHNAVMRPLRQLEKGAGIVVHSLSYVPGSVISADELTLVLEQRRPRLVVLTEASNVTGEIIDLDVAGRICRESGVPLMVDAAQSAGWTEARIEERGVSIWCASGHKGLYGPPGVGLLYVSPGLDLEPVVAGGTGSQSEDLQMPSAYPDRLEAGTLAGPAIAGLAAGVRWLQEVGSSAVRCHERDLVRRFLRWAEQSELVQIAGARTPECRTGVVSFRLKDASPDRVADLLDREYEIAVRSGLHCAALAHRALGTTGSGLVRVGFGYFNTGEDVDSLCDALERIAAVPS